MYINDLQISWFYRQDTFIGKKLSYLARWSLHGHISKKGLCLKLPFAIKLIQMQRVLTVLQGISYKLMLFISQLEKASGQASLTNRSIVIHKIAFENCY